MTWHEKTELIPIHKIYLFIQYISPLLFKILKICKLHKIPYEKLYIIHAYGVNCIRLLGPKTSKSNTRTIERH